MGSGKIQSVGYHETAAKLCSTYLPFQQQNYKRGDTGVWKDFSELKREILWESSS